MLNDGRADRKIHRIKIIVRNKSGQTINKIKINKKKKKPVLKTKYVLKQNTSCSQRVWELNGNSTPRPWFTGIDIDCAGRRTTTHADRGAAPLRVAGRRHLRKSYRPRRRTSRGVSGRGFSRAIFANISPAPGRSYVAPRSVR